MRNRRYVCKNNVAKASFGYQILLIQLFGLQIVAKLGTFRIFFTLFSLVVAHHYLLI